MANPPLERPQSRKEFQALLEALEIPKEQAVISNKFGYGARVAANGDRLLVTWEAHTEYYSYQVWHMPDDKLAPLDFGPITFPDYVFPFSPLGIQVNALDLLVLPNSEFSLEEIRTSMPGPQIYGSHVFDEKISIVASFNPDEYHRERYLVFGPPHLVLLQKISHLIDAVVALENYTHLILLPYQAFSQSVDQVHKFEQRHLYKRGMITDQIDHSKPETLQQWLTGLTQDFMRVSRLAESMRYKLSAAIPYDSIIRANLQALQETPLPACQKISDYVNRKVIGVSGGYQAHLRRIDALVHDFEGTIAVIRTKVDLLLQDQNLALQDQNLKLLSSVDKTTKSQAILQHTVEGLSIIVIAYYLSGLASYVFKALHEVGWLEQYALASGIFVPIAIGISFGLTFIGRKVINKRLFNNEKP
jgi:uncharacterized membrane-anchored protein